MAHVGTIPSWAWQGLSRCDPGDFKPNGDALQMLAKLFHAHAGVFSLPEISAGFGSVEVQTGEYQHTAGRLCYPLNRIIGLVTEEEFESLSCRCADTLA